MTNARIILTTAGSQEEAGKIAHALVERRLAACVNIVTRIESVYRWQGKVESATEWLLLIKTQAELFERVRDAVKELHSYDLPECVMLEVSAGSKRDGVDNRQTSDPIEPIRSALYSCQHLRVWFPRFVLILRGCRALFFEP